MGFSGSSSAEGLLQTNAQKCGSLINPLQSPGVVRTAAVRKGISAEHHTVPTNPGPIHGMPEEPNKQIY